MKKYLLTLPLIAMAMNSFAAAASGAQPHGFNWESILLLVVFIAAFYFLMIRPQMRRNKEQRQMMGQLEKGHEVMTNHGVMGKIEKVGENFVMLTIAKGVHIKVQKSAIGNILPKGSMDAE